MSAVRLLDRPYGGLFLCLCIGWLSFPYLTFTSPLLLLSRAVGENIWKGFPGTGGNFQANEALSAQPGTPTPAICSRRHYRVWERHPAVSSSSEGTREGVLPWPHQGTALLLLGACWELGSWVREQVPFLAPFLCRQVRCPQFQRHSEGLSKDSNEERGFPGCQKQCHQPRTFSSLLGSICRILSVLHPICLLSNSHLVIPCVHPM